MCILPRSCIVRLKPLFLCCLHSLGPHIHNSMQGVKDMQARTVPNCCNGRLLSFMAHRSSDGLRVFKERSALGEQAISMDGSSQILGSLR